MIDDKTGPKGDSYEAEFRKRVLNAKLETHYSGLNREDRFKLVNLESLDVDPRRVIDTSKKKYFSALESEKIPRRFTYLTVEYDREGSIAGAARTLTLMEDSLKSVTNFSGPEKTRRPDFLSIRYELDGDELALVKQHSSIKFREIREHFSSRNLKILPRLMEIKSIDLNTPLGVARALEHWRKQIDSLGASLVVMLDEFALDLHHDGVMNVIMKEWYHLSFKEIETDKLIKMHTYFSKEQHTAIFTLNKVKGKLSLASRISAETIVGKGRLARMRRENRTVLNAAAFNLEEAKGPVRRSVNFLNELHKLIPGMLKAVSKRKS